jgi:hypothetical protein
MLAVPMDDSVHFFHIFTSWLDKTFTSFEMWISFKVFETWFFNMCRKHEVYIYILWGTGRILSILSKCLVPYCIEIDMVCFTMLTGYLSPHFVYSQARVITHFSLHSMCSLFPNVWNKLMCLVQKSCLRPVYSCVVTMERYVGDGVVYSRE